MATSNKAIKLQQPEPGGVLLRCPHCHHCQALQQEEEAALKQRKIHLPLKRNKGLGLDSFSSLPDEILVSVLSLVEMKEAGRTSLLSKRWRYVWTHLTNLEFDAYEKVCYMKRLSTTESERNLEEVRYLNWVNTVVDEHNAPSINTFRVRFMLNRCNTADIDKWLYFAKHKSARILVLNLSCSVGIQLYDSYTLNYSNMFNFKTLESLELVGVSISTLLLSRIFCDGLNLQRLSLHECKAVPDFPLQIAVRSLKLKRLEIRCTWKIKRFEIFAPNLGQFKFCGYEKINVEYHNVASLVDVAFTGSYAHHIRHNSHLLSGFSSQLQKLSLSLNQEAVPFSGFADTFRNLRQLEFWLFCADDYDLLALTSFITSCPLLHTFKLQLFPSRRTPQPVSVLEEAQINAIRTHHHLKLVQFVSYTGSATIARLALFLAKHVPMLEKIVFDPRPLGIGLVGEPHLYGDEYVESVNLARRQAELVVKQIQQLKPDVNVVIM